MRRINAIAPLVWGVMIVCALLAVSPARADIGFGISVPLVQEHTIQHEYAVMVLGAEVGPNPFGNGRYARKGNVEMRIPEAVGPFENDTEYLILDVVIASKREKRVRDLEVEVFVDGVQVHCAYIPVKDKRGERYQRLYVRAGEKGVHVVQIALTNREGRKEYLPWYLRVFGMSAGNEITEINQTGFAYTVLGIEYFRESLIRIGRDYFNPKTDSWRDLPYGAMLFVKEQFLASLDCGIAPIEPLTLGAEIRTREVLDHPVLGSALGVTPRCYFEITGLQRGERCWVQPGDDRAAGKWHSANGRVEFEYRKTTVWKFRAYKAGTNGWSDPVAVTEWGEMTVEKAGVYRLQF